MVARGKGRKEEGMTANWYRVSLEVIKNVPKFIVVTITTSIVLSLYEMPLHSTF
jgi:hypothetical protein